VKNAPAAACGTQIAWFVFGHVVDYSRRKRLNHPRESCDFLGNPVNIEQFWSVLEKSRSSLGAIWNSEAKRGTGAFAFELMVFDLLRA
jgi:hypothetical protein